MEKAFVAWMDYHRRSDLLAQHLDAKMHFIYHEPSRGRILTPFRYLIQGLRTWRILRQDQPDVVFVQNPPIFAVLVAALFAQRCDAKYVIDSHTGAFLSRKWRWSLGLHRLLSKHALATIVHNASQEQILKEWGYRHLVIGFTPGSYPSGEDFPLNGQFNLAVVSSFRADEPVDAIFGAATSLPQMDFYVTGDCTLLTKSLISSKPDNVHLTGYLPYSRYVGLLRAVDAIMVLTTGDQQLLMGGFEAVSLGRPLIVSDSPLLREYFSLGTVHVADAAEDICEGIHYARRNLPVLQQEILILREQLRSEWETGIAELQGLLDEC
jgi:glycosyltransferase involved in cell wall biosynthesis